MKNTLKHLTLITSLILSLSSCQKSEKKLPIIAITQIVEHPSLDQERDGIIKGLEEAGYINDKNIHIVYENAQGSIATSKQIATNFISQNPAIIIAISTPSAQSVMSTIASHDIPIVFSAVTDPVKSKIVTALEKRKENITGSSDKIPALSQIEMILQFMPNIKTIGIIYNPGESNSAIMVEELKDVAERSDLKVIEAVASKTNDVSNATMRLIGKVDAIYVPNDNTAVSAITSIIQIGEQHQIPIFVGDQGSFQKGAVAMNGYDRYALGRALAPYIAKILDGDKASEMKIQTDHPTKIYINKKAAERMGLHLTKEMLLNVNALEE